MSELSDRFPRTFEALGAAGEPGAFALDHLVSLEAAFTSRGADVAIGDDGPGAGAMAFDVAIAGGGLSLVYAALLARRGFRVAVFDRGAIGRGHREWNVSWPELSPLSASGLFTDEEVGRLVRMRYDRGLVRWHGGEPHVVRGVLDCVVDAEALLDSLRARAEAAGATLLSGQRLGGYRVGRGGVEIALVDAASVETRLTARLLLDATGAASPHARFDLVCPTVGGVLDGLARGDAPDETDPAVGEILASTEGVEEGRQHVWEGFPAPPRSRDGAAPASSATTRSTLYLFHYAEPDALPEHPLLSLYERFFRLRHRYKRGRATLEKPTYGFIPGHTRLRAAETAPRDRVLLVGDAASRHSPLTFCGFGSMVRSFLPVGDCIARALERDRLDRRTLAAAWREPGCLGLMGALALMMIPPGSRGASGPPPGDAAEGDPSSVNALVEHAFAALSSLGEEVYGRMIRDEIGFTDFTRFMRETARRHPTIYREVFQQLSPAEIAVWSGRYAAFAARSLAARLPPRG